MEEIPEDILRTMMIIPILIQENPEYMMKTVYELKIEKGFSQIVDCENLFENVTSQYMCLKIVHDVSMMGSYLKSYISETGAKCNSYHSKKKSLYVKFLITPEKIDIINKKGFGFFAYNIDDFAYSLYEFNNALNDFLKTKSKEKNYEFLNVILNDWYSYSFVDPNSAMSSLITKNNDFYKNYIEKIENQ